LRRKRSIAERLLAKKLPWAPPLWSLAAIGFYCLLPLFIVSMLTVPNLIDAAKVSIGPSSVATATVDSCDTNLIVFPPTANLKLTIDGKKYEPIVPVTSCPTDKTMQIKYATKSPIHAVAVENSGTQWSLAMFVGILLAALAGFVFFGWRRLRGTLQTVRVARSEDSGAEWRYVLTRGLNDDDVIGAYMTIGDPTPSFAIAVYESPSTTIPLNGTMTVRGPLRPQPGDVVVPVIDGRVWWPASAALPVESDDDLGAA
jgi:hypothetical protein